MWVLGGTVVGVYVSVVLQEYQQAARSTMLILYISPGRVAVNGVFEMMLSVSRVKTQTVYTANNSHDLGHPIGGSHCS